MAKIPPALCRSELTGQVYFVSSWSKPGLAKTKYDVTPEYQALVEQDTQSLRAVIVALKGTLSDAQRALEICDRAMENLMPGARHIVADIGLINDAFTEGKTVRQTIETILKE